MESLRLQLRAAQQAVEKANQERDAAVQEGKADKQAIEKANQEREKANQEREKAIQERDIAVQARENADRQLRYTTIFEYVDAIHVFISSAFVVQTNKSMATQGDPKNATSKFCPTKIKPWVGFQMKQNTVWKNLRNLDETIKSSRALSSINAIQDYGDSSSKRKIASEKDLETYERNAVEDPVTKILDFLCEYPDVKEKFHMNGSVTFENHPNTLNDDSAIEDQVKRMKITANHPSALLKDTDQICVYQTEDGKPIPCFIVEYKAPHKLTIAHIEAGLRPMNPWKDIINNPKIPPDKSDEAAGYYSSKLVAAVVTQTFSYMIEAGLEYAYICTGEAFIFLHVQPKDPTTVYYYLSTPNNRVGESTGWEADSNRPNRLHLTAVGQVLAFILQALSTKQQNSDWISKAKSQLERWEVDPTELLRKIPETVRKDIQSSAYKSRQKTSAIKVHNLRSKPPEFNNASCNSDETLNDYDEFDDDNDGDEEDENDHGLVGTPSRSSRSQGTSSRNQGTSSKNQGASKRTTTESYDRWYERKNQCQAMAFCTQRCLRGLLTGGLLDENCPNVETHRKRDNSHCIDPSTFRELMRKQLSESLVTDCHALDIQGSRGALFKVRLTSHGYTVATKCTVQAYISDLLHEAVVYKQLDKIQGIYIPVCLGNIDLPEVLAYNCVQFVHMMFLSWGGQCINLDARLSKESHIRGQAIEAMRAIHQLGVLHRDAMPRNILWSEEVKHVMFIDFERSEIRKVLSKRPLMPTSGNEQRKGNVGDDMMDWKNEMRLNMKLKAKQDNEIGSDAPKFQILGGEDIKNKVDPTALDAPKLQILDEDTKKKSKPKRSPLTDFAREMRDMEAELVRLTC